MQDKLFDDKSFFFNGIQLIRSSINHCVYERRYTFTVRYILICCQRCHMQSETTQFVASPIKIRIVPERYFIANFVLFQ